MIEIKYFLILLLYSTTLYLFGVYVCLIEFLEISVGFLFSSFYKLDPVYDYIIVGCGSAGSTVALRLSENKNSTVLVLEAGPLGGRWFDIPAVGILLQLSSVDWKYSTVPQANAAKAFNNQVSKWPMGRALGGSGRINNMIYLRGHPADFKEWFRNADYNFTSDILQYFKKSEDHVGAFKNNIDFHSTGGPLIVEDLSQVTPLASAILEGVESLGYPIQDLNSRHSAGFMKPQVSVKRGTRWTPAHRLQTVNRPNLIIQTNTFVKKILLKSDYEAYGVEYSYLGKESTVKARKGIILSAGVIGTPKLLMLSGIGIEKHLSTVGVKTKINLPVGNNLQDHVTTGADLILLNITLGLDLFTMYSPYTIFNYFFRASGLWTTVGCEALGLLHTSCFDTNASLECNKNEYQPDLQLMVIPVGAATDGGKHLVKAAGFTKSSWYDYFEHLIGKTSVSILPIVLHPKSKGTVRLVDSNPYNHPLINPNYLSDPYDVDILLKGIEIIKKIISTTPMQRLGAKLNSRKFPGCEKFDFDTKPYWECYVRHLTITSYHPVGTCKMGDYTDRETVVGYDFRVHNTNKLYIADASVIPSSLSANPNAAVVVVGEKVAEQIKHDKFLNEGCCDLIEILVPNITC